MVGAPPALERAYGVTNIKSHIPIILDTDEHNYDAWGELFLNHYQSFDVVGQLDHDLRTKDIRDLNIQAYCQQISSIVDFLTND